MSVKPIYDELLQNFLDLKKGNNELRKFELSFQAADAGIALINLNE